MSVKGVLRVEEGGRFSFWCKGCEEHHSVDAGWTFNGNYDHPTFTPSILVTSGHYMSSHKPGDACWCTYNSAHPNDPDVFKCQRCHSHVTNGMIQYLPDSTHSLAGQTVALAPPDERGRAI